MHVTELTPDDDLIAETISERLKANPEFSKMVAAARGSSDFYRLHTFAVKGPNRRETRNYLRERSLLMKSGKVPFNAPDMRASFEQGRAAKLGS